MSPSQLLVIFASLALNTRLVFGQATIDCQRPPQLVVGFEFGFFLILK